MAPQPRRQFSWFRFLLVNTIGTLLILEVALRVTYGGVFSTRFFEPHSQYGHFHVPGRSGWYGGREFKTWVEINANGLRDGQHSYHKPDDTYRILFVGDSFTEGLQVPEEQTFPSQLEARLSEQSDRPVEVINAGVIGYGTDNSLLLLEGEGLRYEPDLVVYAFYLNDVADNTRNEIFHLEDGELEQGPIRVPLTYWMRGPLYDVSYVYRALSAIITTVRARNDASRADRETGNISPMYRQSLLPREESGWVLTTVLMERMQQDVSAAGARFLVVYVPGHLQVDDGAWAAYESAPVPVNRDGPNTRLSQELPPGALFLDLTPGFRAAPADEPLYYRIDRHFNAAGHMLAADLIAEYVESDVLPLDGVKADACCDDDRTASGAP